MKIKALIFSVIALLSFSVCTAVSMDASPGYQVEQSDHPVITLSFEKLDAVEEIMFVESPVILSVSDNKLTVVMAMIDNQILLPDIRSVDFFAHNYTYNKLHITPLRTKPISIPDAGKPTKGHRFIEPYRNC